MVINDFLRGKIPWYIPDPSWPERKAKERDEKEFGGSEGRLGEKRLKVGQNDTKSGDSGSWDGLDVDSDVVDDDDDDEEEEEEKKEEDEEEEVVAESEARDSNQEDLENDRIEDPRPPKKARR